MYKKACFSKINFGPKGKKVNIPLPGQGYNDVATQTNLEIELTLALGRVLFSF
jgi:hypothetical protein